MGIRLRKNAVDLGIVAKDGSTMLSFYRDLLGFRRKGDIPFPMGGCYAPALVRGQSN